MNLLLAIIKHPPHALYFVGWGLFGVGVLLIAAEGVRQFRSRRAQTQAYEVDREVKRAGGSMDASRQRSGIRTSDTARVTTKRGRISGQDRAVDARDQSEVDMEDTDIE
jgi:hypothetical protein